MGDDTRRILKVFGVTVTDFEVEAEKLIARADQITATSDRDELLSLIADMGELCHELGQRWLETTQHVVAMQDRFVTSMAKAASRARG